MKRGNPDARRGMRGMTDAKTQDVLTLIRLLRELMKEDTKTLAAITCDEAELIEGGTSLPTVRLLAHELIGVAQKALDALGADGGEEKRWTR